MQQHVFRIGLEKKIVQNQLVEDSSFSFKFHQRRLGLYEERKLIFW